MSLCIHDADKDVEIAVHSLRDKFSIRDNTSNNEVAYTHADSSINKESATANPVNEEVTDRGEENRQYELDTGRDEEDFVVEAV